MSTPGAAVLPVDDEAALLVRLRAGDERAFTALVERYHGALTRLAMPYVRSRALAEEVAQETWLAVLRGLDRFEGRSSLRTWIFRILLNRARTRGVEEARSIPFSSFDPGSDVDDAPAVDPDRFIRDGRLAGHWAIAPRTWAGAPEERLLAAEGRGVIEAAIAGLPPSQRAVITLRDVEGWSADEVCGLLGLSDGNQRVLLHRGRSRVRSALEAYLGEDPPPPVPREPGAVLAASG